MRLDKLNEFFLMETKQEKWHKEHPDQPSERYETLEYIIKDNEKVYFFDFSEEMLIEDIMIIKETRYTKLYPHFHKYMELNYVYRGKCVFTINGKEVIMEAGDICLLQPNVIHSALSKSENDIVLNIAFSDCYTAFEFFDSIDTPSSTSRFLQSYFDKTREQNEYLIFKHMQNSLLEDVLLNVFYIYFSERTINYNQMMKHYLSLIFIHLTNAAIDQAFSDIKEDNDEIVFHVLQYINKNFSSCNLQAISAELGYNYTYLSNLIKKKTGKTFSEIKLEQQMEVAKKLIQQSNMPIYRIIEYCGFMNQSFFYKKFEDRFHCSPIDMRV